MEVTVSECGQLRLPTQGRCLSIWHVHMSCDRVTKATSGRQVLEGARKHGWHYNSRYVVLEHEKLIVEMVTHICKSTKEEPHRTARL